MLSECVRLLVHLGTVFPRQALFSVHERVHLIRHERSAAFSSHSTVGSWMLGGADSITRPKVGHSCCDDSSNRDNLSTWITMAVELGTLLNVPSSYYFKHSPNPKWEWFSLSTVRLIVWYSLPNDVWGPFGNCGWICRNIRRSVLTSDRKVHWNSCLGTHGTRWNSPC